MNKYESKRMNRLIQLSEKLRVVARAALDIEIGDEKTMDKAKNKIYNLMEQIENVATLNPESFC